jgi:Aspartyl protease
MPLIEWGHNRQRLVLPIVVMASVRAANPNLSIRTMGLIDTGATGTGIRADVAETLDLRAKGQRRVNTANGMMMAAEYLVRIGFVCGDYRDPDFVADRQQPYVLDKQYTGFALQAGFAYPVLIGMDILGEADLALNRDGNARLHLY